MVAALALLFTISAQAQYIGSQACAGCHPDQFKAQSSSAHARSLSRAAAHHLAPAFGEFITARQPVPEWAFGAGSQAVTFVSRVDDASYLEHHLSYYSALKRLAPTPGHDGKPEPGVLYRTFGPGAEILRCFQCHSTGVPSVESGARIQPREPGVRCEACHGPGEAHLRAAGKAPLVHPGKYTPAELNQMCGSCHRKPAAAGDDTDYSNAWNARHQPLYLSQSKCFLRSNGKLSCLTCHDAHTGTTREACSSCHTAVKHPASIQLTGRRCESCHMPPVRPQTGLRFSNHWIGVYRSPSTLVPMIR